jgi:hypothetical protein
MLNDQVEYSDDYPTCKAIYASLLIYHEDLDPEHISRRLSLTPSAAFVKGHSIGTTESAPRGGWFLSTKGVVTSKDARRHVDWLLDRLEGRESELAVLRERGYEMSISCYWLSVEGHGGPTLSPPQMRRLSALELEIWFDMY